MRETIQFLFLGLGLGAMYALVSSGLIVIYRGSGVLNFAHGAIGMVAAYLFHELRDGGMPFILALVLGVAAAAAIGVLMHLVVMRHLERAAPLTRVVATLGVLIALQAIAVIRYGPTTITPKSDLPTSTFDLFGINVAIDRMILAGLAIVICCALWSVYRFTAFGRSTEAVAENQRNAAALGLSPNRIATANWALGSALSGLAMILLAPIVTLTPNVFTTLLIAALAAALVASFRSFPITLVAGLLLGIAQTEVSLHWSQPGVGPSIPFLVIAIVLVARGQALPLRDFLLQRLPAIGTGRIRLVPVIIGVAVVALLLPSVPSDWQDGIVVTFATATILLSIVVVTGYTGQISLGQFALAGVGAWVAGRLSATQGTPFPLALVIGVACSVPVGVLFAVPALRARGINLAIVTLGLGTALELMLFNNPAVTGGFTGTLIKTPTLFGWDLDPLIYPQRYGWIVLAAFTLVALMVANLRRGRSGRRLLAVRNNERAAAALGVDVVGAKIFAFTLSAGIAALGGVLLTFRFTSINYSQFTTFTSIADVGYAVLGGVGFLLGPIFGSTLAPGAVGLPFGNHVLSGLAEYLDLIGGVSIVFIALANQNGIAPEIARQLRWVAERIPGLRRLVRRSVAVRRERLPEGAAVERVQPRTLFVKDLVVKYGAVTAADGVDLLVEPGRVVGLIGPNGAGKTTVIDAITGFTRISSGTVLLDDTDISSRKVFARARMGVSRSFQSLELFEDSTVLENLRTASDPRDRWAYLRDLIRPKTPPLPPQAMAAIEEFKLGDCLDMRAEDLSYGRRRLLAIARAVAAGPSVLLLDEPAAGLGDAETAELGSLVRRLADEWGMGILVVEHDMRFVMSVCDDLAVLDFGRQIASGPSARVRTDPAVRAAYLGETEQERDQDAGPATVVGAAPVAPVVSPNGNGMHTLEARGLSTGYGAQPVVHDLDIAVDSGEVVLLLGANGAGKTTTLLALAGELPLIDGAVLIGGDVTTAPLHLRARNGLAIVPEERSVFRQLTTLENLRLGDADPSIALELFPELEKRLQLRAGMLSGGEQQMLSLGRALSRRPAVLLADELSLGLAPMATQRLLEAVRRSAKEHGTAVILVEQHVRKALQYGDRGYVLRSGRVEVAGTTAELRARLGEIEDTYLATTAPVAAPVS